MPCARSVGMDEVTPLIVEIMWKVRERFDHYSVIKHCGTFVGSLSENTRISVILIAQRERESIPSESLVSSGL